MPWQSGTPVRDNGDFSGSVVWQDDAAAGTKILASNHDNHDQDMADMIGECLHRGGQNAMLADADWGGYRINNLGAPEAANDAATKTYVDGEVAALSNIPNNLLYAALGASSYPYADADLRTKEGFTSEQVVTGDLAFLLLPTLVTGLSGTQETIRIPSPGTYELLVGISVWTNDVAAELEPALDLFFDSTGSVKVNGFTQALGFNSLGSWSVSGTRPSQYVTAISLTTEATCDLQFSVRTIKAFVSGSTSFTQFTGGGFVKVSRIA